MADQWFVQRDGQKLGPMPTAKLKQLAASGKVSPTDLVQKEGMGKWVQASAVKGLFPAATPGKASAPVPDRPAPTKGDGAGFEFEDNASSVIGRPLPRSAGGNKWLWIGGGVGGGLLAVVLLIVVIVNAGKGKGGQSGKENPDLAKAGSASEENDGQSGKTPANAPPKEMLMVEAPARTIGLTKTGGGIGQLDFTPDGKAMFVVNGQGGLAAFYDPSSGEKTDLIRDLDFADAEKPPDFLRLSDDAGVRFWLEKKKSDVLRRALGVREKSQGGGVIAISRDERFAVLQYPQNAERGGQTAWLKVFDLQSGEEVRLKLDPEDKGYRLATHVTLSPDSRLLVVCARTGADASSPKGTLWSTTKVWDIRTGAKVQTLPPPTPTVSYKNAMFSPDGKVLTTRSEKRTDDKTFKDMATETVWNTATWDKMAVLTITGTFYSEKLFSPDGKLLALVTAGDRAEERVVSLWECATGRKIGTIQTKNAYFHAFTPDGKFLVTGRNRELDKQAPRHYVSVWHIPSGQLHARIADDLITAVALSPDGNLIATGNRDHQVKIWDIARGRKVPYKDEFGQ